MWHGVSALPHHVDIKDALWISGSTEEDERKNAIAADLRHQIKNRIGTSAAVEVREPGGIERSVGKARRIVDKRRQTAS